MKVEVVKPEPVENKVIIELSESEAAVLRSILSHVYNEASAPAAARAMTELHSSLADEMVTNTKNVGVAITGVGMRLYNLDAEW